MIEAFVVILVSTSSVMLFVGSAVAKQSVMVVVSSISYSIYGFVYCLIVFHTKNLVEKKSSNIAYFGIAEILNTSLYLVLIVTGTITSGLVPFSWITVISHFIGDIYLISYVSYLNGKMSMILPQEPQNHDDTNSRIQRDPEIAIRFDPQIVSDLLPRLPNYSEIEPQIT